MLYTIIFIGSLFFLWRLFKWKNLGFPVEKKSLNSPNFFISILGILIAAALVIMYAESNPAFSWGLVVAAVTAGIIISMIEAFSYEKKKCQKAE